MPVMTMTAGDFLPLIPGMPNLEELLADVAWLYQVDMHDHLSIRATVKPDLSLNTELGLLAQLTAGYVKVVEILMGAGVVFWNMPGLEVKGRAHGWKDQLPAGGFHGIEAVVRIELEYPRPPVSQDVAVDAALAVLDAQGDN